MAPFLYSEARPFISLPDLVALLCVPPMNAFHRMALDDVMKAIRDGAIGATGIEIAPKGDIRKARIDRTPIPRSVWHQLGYNLELNWLWRWDVTPDGDDCQRPVYVEIEVARDAAEKIWPIKSTRSHAARAKSAKSLEAWLSDALRKAPSTWTKEKFLAAARAEIGPELSKSGFLKVWKRVTAGTQWGHSGRRPAK